ncbi:MAG TPA: hypothetical protein VMW38_19010, partial [Terriglobia bacterium]|nr:hypothetical protein [Terriglobia bacterium]
ATAVEVAEGRELSGIDFKVARFLRGYHVSGFIQEADSGQAVPNLRFMISRLDENGRRRGSFSSGLGGANGEFEQGDLLPGKYSLVLGPLDEANYSADLVDFEISDQDVKGLILRLRKGDADISGQVILEGMEPADAASKMRTLELRAELVQHSAGMWKRTALAADGTFTFRGLPSGKVTFSVNSSDLFLVRCEFNGPPGNYLLEGIPLESGQQITGLKLFFVEGKGTLVGLVRTKAGPLPSGVRCYVEPVLENNTESIFGTETDDRGMFRFEELPPGEVVLHIQPYVPAFSGTSKPVEFQEVLQRVTLRPRQETRTEIVIDLVPEKEKVSPDAPKP